MSEGTEQQASEMVDRVARAMRNHVDGATRYDLLSEQEARELARAAIAAMREPTMDMLDAGDCMMPQIAKGQDISTGYDALKDAWPAMIDAALAPASSGTAISASPTPDLSSEATSGRGNENGRPEPNLEGSA